MKLLNFSLALILFFCISSTYSQPYTIRRYVTDAASGEALIGATVYIKTLNKGVAANVYGFYSLTLQADTYVVTCSFLGYETINKYIFLNRDTSWNILLNTSKNLLGEVTIVAYEAEEDKRITSNQMSTIKLSTEQITSIPAIGGEADLIKVMQLIPGVKRGDDGQTGMYVRGGDGDQNLILLDEATVYNVAHLFGFFSIFNTDAIKDISLIKGGFPANYGGRLSSVLDIRMKEGNLQQYHGEGGIGLLSSRITLEGPLKKDKMSFIVSGRRSYIDQVVKALNYLDPTTPLLPYYFYDVNAKLNYKVSDKDRLYLSTYYGNDVLKFKADLSNSLFNFDFILGNYTNAFRWNHLYNSKIFSNISIIHSRFRYDVEGTFIDNSVLIKSSIRDLGVKADFDYYKNPENHIMFGLSVINHNFRPNVVSTVGEISSTYKSSEGVLISTQESAIYALNESSISDLFKINYGIRFSFTNSQNTFYTGLEPRILMSYSLNKNGSVKLSYSRNKQYMHLVSSSSIALPTDLWYPVTDKVKPQSSDQVALGYTYLLDKIKTLATVETYYKWMKNLIEYKEGAVLILNDNYEDELVTGMGNAYGAECYLVRSSNRFTASFGYTLSWALRNFDALNKGESYYAKYDRRHDIAITGKYDLTNRLSLAIVWVYSTGSRLTPMVGQFFMPNASLSSIDILPIYSEKNAVKLPSSHRLDFNFVLKSKLNKRWKSEWHFGAYNVYNRTQPYRIRISGESGNYKYEAIGLFGFVPSIAYNFKF